jgi:hypothetical protein
MTKNYFEGSGLKVNSFKIFYSDQNMCDVKMDNSAASEIEKLKKSSRDLRNSIQSKKESYYKKRGENDAIFKEVQDHS